MRTEKLFLLIFAAGVILSPKQVLPANLTLSECLQRAKDNFYLLKANTYLSLKVKGKKNPCAKTQKIFHKSSLKT